MRASEPLAPRERRPVRAPSVRRRPIWRRPGGGSRRGRMLGFVVAGLVLFVALLWFGPRYADWSAHRAAVEAVASELLGRDVKINGEIHLILLPEPSIAAEKVQVGDSGDGVRMTTAGLTLNLSLGALLTGHIAVTHIELDRPDIRLPWPLPGGPDAIEPPPWLAALSADVRHGSVSFGTLHVTDADLSVVTGGVESALAVDGTAKAGGLPLQVDLDLSWQSADGSAPGRLSLSSTAGPASSILFQGKMTRAGQLTGRFAAQGADLSSFMAAPAWPFDVKAQLVADDRTIRLSDLAATVGTRPVTGTIALRLASAQAPLAQAPRLVMTLHTPMLDLAPWLKAFPAAGSAGVPLRLSLDADDATYGEGLLRHVGLTLATVAGQVRIDALTATLPGEAGLTLAGFYNPQNANFSGQMKLAAPSPLVTLHWLAQAQLVPDLGSALTGLDTLAIDSRVDAGPHQVALTEITGLMNDTTMSGGIVLSGGKKPRVSAGLAFGRVDLGQWLPTNWLTEPPRPDSLAQALGGINADLQLSANEVWLGDDRLDHTLLDADIEDGSVNLRQFASQDAGLQILASGALDKTGALHDGRLVVTAPHATPLVDLLPRRLRSMNPDFWAAPLAATVTASGPPTALAVALQGQLGDLGLSAQPVMDLVHHKWRGALTLQHPSAARLIGAFGFGQAAAWLGDGSLSVVATVASDDGAWRVGPLSFSLGLVHGGGSLAYQASVPPQERRVTGALRFSTLPWPHPAASDPVPLALLRGWNATVALSVETIANDLSPVAKQVQANADVTDGVLRLAVEHAALMGGTAFGTIKLDSADPPHAALELGLQNATVGSGPAPAWVPKAFRASHLDARLLLTANGYSLSSWRASLSGVVAVTAADGSLPGISLAATGSAVKAGEAGSRMLFSGATPFDSLTATGTIAQGELQLTQATLAGKPGRMNATGQVDLVRGVCNLSLALEASAAPPATGLDKVNAMLRGPVRDPQAWIVGSTTPN